MSHISPSSSSWPNYRYLFVSALGEKWPANIKNSLIMSSVRSWCLTFLRGHITPTISTTQKCCDIPHFVGHSWEYHLIGNLGLIASTKETLKTCDVLLGGQHSSWWGPFYEHGLTLIMAWASNCIHSKAWDEITCHFQTSTVQPLKFGNGCVITSLT